MDTERVSKDAGTIHPRTESKFAAFFKDQAQKYPRKESKFAAFFEEQEKSPPKTSKDQETDNETENMYLPTQSRSAAFFGVHAGQESHPDTLVTLLQTSRAEPADNSPFADKVQGKGKDQETASEGSSDVQKGAGLRALWSPSDLETIGEMKAITTRSLELFDFFTLKDTSCDRRYGGYVKKTLLWTTYSADTRMSKWNEIRNNPFFGILPLASQTEFLDSMRAKLYHNAFKALESQLSSKRNKTPNQVDSDAIGLTIALFKVKRGKEWAKADDEDLRSRIEQMTEPAQQGILEVFRQVETKWTELMQELSVTQVPSD
ncbi:MAG: hypothetical protein ASARMPRED_001622 [Alectoria sarmentosa]|nr:MAG: hypothetical protein ASARMPRED_001622 [Alectoria sarmentosa]